LTACNIVVVVGPLFYRLVMYRFLRMHKIDLVCMMPHHLCFRIRFSAMVEAAQIFPAHIMIHKPLIREEHGAVGYSGFIADILYPLAFILDKLKPGARLTLH